MIISGHYGICEISTQIGMKNGLDGIKGEKKFSGLSSAQAGRIKVVHAWVGSVTQKTSWVGSVIQKRVGSVTSFNYKSHRIININYKRQIFLIFKVRQGKVEL